jgi:hypothetical protein
MGMIVSGGFPMDVYWFFRTVAAATCLSSIFCCSALAEMAFKEDQYHALFVTVSGTITEQDAEALARWNDRLPYFDQVFVHLNSSGGSLSAAMKIGRLLRKYEGRTSIPAGAKCYSSCALIFISGITRYSDGELGLHRPYFGGSPQKRETIEKEVPALLSALKTFVAEMGITNTFYEVMINTEPSRVAIYRGNKSETLVPITDPVADEIDVAGRAKDYGISTSEYRKRSHTGCTGPIDQNVFTCMEAAVWGLSIPVYEDRFAQVKKECWANADRKWTDEQRMTLRNTPRIDRAELTFVEQFHACERRVMLGK